MKQSDRLKLGYEPQKTKNIATCMFLDEDTCVKLRCTINIHTNHIAIYQEVRRLWHT